MPKVQLFITTYNRPLFLLETVQSALNQDFDSYEIIVSDNSTNDETEELIAKFKSEKIIYKRRIPSLTAIDHINSILKEVSSDFFMVFHDDDVMHKDMIKTLYQKISLNPEVVAIGSNAKLLINGVLRKKNYYPDLKSDKLIVDSDDLVKRYLLYDMVPFPSYLYKANVAKVKFFDKNKGGKYSDAVFIIDLLTLGPIIFCAKPLMDYRIHSGQDSTSNDFNQKCKLINYYTRISTYGLKHPLILRFRIQNLFGETVRLIMINRFSLKEKRNVKIAILILKHSPFEYFPRLAYAILFKNSRLV